LSEVLRYRGVDFDTGKALPISENLGLGPDPDEVTLRKTGELLFKEVPGYLTLWVREETGNGKGVK
ncbi:MAG: hypothetical protein Q7S44_04565, partial [bacterium]|nr:hypothetical protein [bacterium]